MSEGDYIRFPDIPGMAREIEELRARIAELETFRAGVPWEAIAATVRHSNHIADRPDIEQRHLLSKWLNANRPPTAPPDQP